MFVVTVPTNTECAREHLAYADLSCVEETLCDEYPRWGDNRIARAFALYRQFMEYVSANQNMCVSPPSDVDEVWKAHMSHESAYAKYCMEHFGRKLYRVPNCESAHVHRFIKKDDVPHADTHSVWWMPVEELWHRYGKSAT